MSAPARSARGFRRDRRLRSVSVATSRPKPSMAPASASVLPPPPAHKSITVSPGCAASARQASCEPVSCTSILPSRNSGHCSTCVPVGRRSPCGVAVGSASTGSTRVARRALRALTRISSGARSSRASASRPSTPDLANRSANQSGATPPLAGCSLSPIGAGPYCGGRIDGSTSARRSIAARPVSGTGPQARMAA